MKTRSVNFLLPAQAGLLLALGFVCARLVSLLSMPLEGLRGYGDYTHFYQLATLPGWPFFDYWVEFPPVFSFLSALLVRAAGEQEHVYGYLLFFILTLADAGNVVLFLRLVRRVAPGEEPWLRGFTYFVLLLSLAYAWWYFDSLAVFFMLAGIHLFFEGKITGSSAALAGGILTKYFPGLVLLLGWRRLALKVYVRWVIFTLVPAALTWGLLWAASPTYTAASFISQGSKGSWETIWALLDGNLSTGNFGPEIERLDPATAYQPMGKPAVVPPWASLLGFGLLGLAGLSRLAPQNDRQSLAVLGFGWCLFVLWSPGWSPQWVLYLVPLILLVLPARQALLFTLMLVLVNLLEWPVLLSRGFFEALPLTVILRSLLAALLAWVFFQEARGKMV